MRTGRHGVDGPCVSPGANGCCGSLWKDWATAEVLIASSSSSSSTMTARSPSASTAASPTSRWFPRCVAHPSQSLPGRHPWSDFRLSILTFKSHRSACAGLSEGPACPQRCPHDGGGQRTRADTSRPAVARHTCRGSAIMGVWRRSGSRCADGADRRPSARLPCVRTAANRTSATLSSESGYQAGRPPRHSTVPERQR